MSFKPLPLNGARDEVLTAVLSGWDGRLERAGAREAEASWGMLTELSPLLTPSLGIRAGFLLALVSPIACTPRAPHCHLSASLVGCPEQSNHNDL